MGKPWFRMYHEMIDDPKISTLTDLQFRLWTELLCLACRVGKGGDLGMNQGAIRHQLRKKTLKPFEALFEKELIRLSDKGNVVIAKWKNRQFESDTSTPRVRKHRWKNKASKKVIEGPF